MKRISLIILSALLALTVVSCSDSRAGEEPAEDPAVTEAVEEAAPAPAEEKTEEPAEEEPVEAPPAEPENVEIVSGELPELSRRLIILFKGNMAE